MSIKINIKNGDWIMDVVNYYIFNCSISNCFDTL